MLNEADERTTSAAGDYTAAFTVERTPEEAYAAIINPRQWWAGTMGGGGVVTGTTDQLGAEWVFEYPPYHYSRQKVVELTPGKRVVWDVLESRLTFIKDEQEWTGTHIVFDISRTGDKTEVRFTHVGLKPEVECYDNCSDAWSGYIKGALKMLILNGPK